ncbi:RHS repeat-associated core domain-containing protein [Pseudomonas purpurea]|uniref:RHS repeat-associated core domain-containing protein n=1 Tax=Pseudomonas purpurea TaxID=3136737 RepID=UPI0032678224
MSDTTPASLNAFTPTLTALDPRGLAVRAVNYHRAQGDAPAQSRITRQKYDWHGRLSASIDPRLGLLAESDAAVPDNLSNTFNVSAAVLFSNSVDSGWRLDLLAETGKSVCFWDGRGARRQQQYDALGRLVAVIESTSDQPAAVVECLRYGASDIEMARHNQCGRLVRHDDTGGTVFTSDYGLLGSPLEQGRRFTKALTVPDWPLEEAAREALLEEQQATTCWDFNALGESLSQVDARQNIQRTVYDVAGNLKSAYLRVKGAGEKTVVSAVTYDVLNRVKGETAGNGVKTTFEYDEGDGRLVHLYAMGGDQQSLQSLRYEYDPVGNVLTINDEAAVPVYFRNQRVEHRCTYTYDSLYQLIKSTGFEAIRGHGPAAGHALYTSVQDSGQVANYREDYDYDGAGNLCTLVHVGANQYTRRMITAAHSNRSLAVYEDELPGEPEIGNGFDRNGNLRALLRGQVLEWNGRNQLYRVTPVIRPDGQHDSEVYGYDSDGQRLRKSATRLSKVRVVTREVRYLPGLELHCDAVNNKTYQVIKPTTGHSHISVMYWESDPPAGVEREFWRYSLSDHVQSSSVELSQAGEVLSQERYYPYGGTAWWVDNGSPEASYKTIRYAGKERDASGLYYYGLRYYAPWLQRWINPDPAGDIDGLNLYRFVRNNPVTLRDANGLSPVTLLYGFDTARERVVPGLYAAYPDQSIVTIDKLNAALMITPENAKDDYLGVVEMINEGIEIEDENAKFFMSVSPSYRGTAGDAKLMLQSWAGYLKSHSSSLSIERKMNTYESSQASGKSPHEFWAKNLDAPIPTANFEEITGLLQTTPNDFFALSSGTAKMATNAVVNWFFRQTSKLGLSWFAETQAEGSIVFLDVALKSPAHESSGWTQLQPDVFGAKPYKTASEVGKTYNPITFSERRYLEKKLADSQSMQANRTRILNHAAALTYMK